jgi:hypothetical protein
MYIQVYVCRLLELPLKKIDRQTLCWFAQHVYMKYNIEVVRQTSYERRY